MSRPKNKTVPVASPQNLRLEAAAGDAWEFLCPASETSSIVVTAK